MPGPALEVVSGVSCSLAPAPSLRCKLHLHAISFDPRYPNALVTIISAVANSCACVSHGRTNPMLLVGCGHSSLTNPSLCRRAGRHRRPHQLCAGLFIIRARVRARGAVERQRGRGSNVRARTRVRLGLVSFAVAMPAMSLLLAQSLQPDQDGGSSAASSGGLEGAGTIRGRVGVG